jgi:transposase InsO family protein
MSYKLSPPDLGSKSYERWKQELLAWQEITSLDKKKQGIAVALSLPENDENRVRGKLFAELKLDKLKQDDGMKQLVDFLDKHLGKDDIVDSLEKFEEFEDCKRSTTQTISEFILDFDYKYNTIKNKNMTLPSEILAFKLLKCAQITREERMLVLTGMDYTKKDTLYDQAKTSLKKFKGEHSVAVGGTAVKLEPTFLAENEEALAAAGFYRYSGGGSSRGRYGRGGYGRGGYGRGGSNGRGYGRGYQERSGGYDQGRGKSDQSTFREQGRGAPASDRPVNPKDENGKYLTCHACGSFRHMVTKCPHSWENIQASDNVKLSNATDQATDDCLFIQENVVMFTGYDKDQVRILGDESRNCAVLDTACTSTVCGRKWLQCFLGTLTDQERSSMQRSPGRKIFKFGGGEKLKSTESVCLPCTLAGKEVRIQVDVVDSDIPLLLSLKSLKGAGVKLDLEKDEAVIFGRTVSLDFTSSGHYCVPVDKVQETSVYSVSLEELDSGNRKKAIEKLHRQFVHPSPKRFIGLLKDANVWRDEFQSEVDQIYDSCVTCKQYAKTPARPVVSMPLASRFNEMVAMDLKLWGGNKLILHMVDMFTRLSVSVFVRSKRASDIVNSVMQHWAATWGMMGGMLFDNGGEFSNAEMREVGSMLGVNICTTPAESPWSNGLCERNHQVTDRMLEILKDENPSTDLGTLLAWANMAKNSLQMWNGFSSFQLVIGQNPNLPNIMTGQLPSLHGATSSECLHKHLNALHSARKAFIQCEADEKIRRALRHQVRAVEEKFEPNDTVYYKREGHNKWLGPGKVIFQDGRLVFVRHGGVYVRVSTNRVIKHGSEFRTGSEINEHTSVPEGKPRHGVVSEKFCASAGTSTDGAAASGTSTAVSGTSTAVSGTSTARSGTSTAVGGTSVRAKQASSDLKPLEQIAYKPSESDTWTKATVIGRAGKATGKLKNWFNIEKDSTKEKVSVDLGQIQWERVNNLESVNSVIIPRDRHSDSACMEAKKAELDKLKQFGTYSEVSDSGQRCISTRWVLNQKGEEVKARLVARGFEEESETQNDSPTISKSALRLFLAITASRNWTVKTTDIRSAFLQGKKLDRDVFITPPKEAGVKQGIIWKLNHCLYGLNDAARQFYMSVREVLLELGCEQSKLDPALFMLKKSGTLVGLLVCHIDDFLHSGEMEFDKVLDALRRRFIAGRLEERQFTYIGFSLEQHDDAIVMDQSIYVKELEGLHLEPKRAILKQDSLTNSEQTLLRSQVGRLNWAVQGTRPDLSFDMVDLSTRFKSGVVADLIHVNKIIRRVKEEPAKIVFPNLGNPTHWKVVVYSDASFANICGGVGSLGAHIVLLMGQHGRCCPLAWHAGKIKRVVKSTIAAEALSLQEGLDNGFYLIKLMEEILGIQHGSVKLEAIVDNKSVVEAVYSTKMVEDKRLRLDIAAIQQSIQSKEVAAVQWCPGERQIANCMTKKGASGYSLLGVLQTGLVANL